IPKGLERKPTATATRFSIRALSEVTPFRNAEDSPALLETLIAEKNPALRLEAAAIARRFPERADMLTVLHKLLLQKEDATDPAIPMMIWLAYEPHVVAQRTMVLRWLRVNAAGNPLVTEHIVPRAMRRLVATGKADDLAACVAFL